MLRDTVHTRHTSYVRGQVRVLFLICERASLLLVTLLGRPRTGYRCLAQHRKAGLETLHACL